MIEILKALEVERAVLAEVEREIYRYHGARPNTLLATALRQTRTMTIGRIEALERIIERLVAAGRIWTT